MHFVKNAVWVADYRVMLTFEDGAERLANLAPYLDGEVLEPLRDINYFRKLRVNQDIDTVVWPNDADFSPDFLYEISLPVNAVTAVADK